MPNELRIGMVGYGFMGRAHSNAYHRVNQFFDTAYQPVLKAIAARDQVPVDVDGHLNRAMAHLVAHVGEALAPLNEQGRQRMAEVVEPDAPQLRLRGTERVLVVVEVERVSREQCRRRWQRLASGNMNVHRPERNDLERRRMRPKIEPGRRADGCRQMHVGTD